MQFSELRGKSQGTLADAAPPTQVVGDRCYWRFSNYIASIIPFKLETNVIPSAVLCRAICRWRKMGHKRNLTLLVINF